ncbi:MAG: hypothetical protein R2724_34355 [Bryobacterales bacterium]
MWLTVLKRWVWVLVLIAVLSSSVTAFGKDEKIDTGSLRTLVPWDIRCVGSPGNVYNNSGVQWEEHEEGEYDLVATFYIYSNKTPRYVCVSPQFWYLQNFSKGTNRAGYDVYETRRSNVHMVKVFFGGSDYKGTTKGRILWGYLVDSVMITR